MGTTPLKLTVAGDYAISTARQSSERPPRSESPCRISRTGYATRRLRLRGQQCGIRFHGHSKGTSLVGVRSTFDIRGFPARSTKSRGFPAVATVKTSSPQIHQCLPAAEVRSSSWRTLASTPSSGDDTLCPPARRDMASAASVCSLDWDYGRIEESKNRA